MYASILFELLMALCLYDFNACELQKQINYANAVAIHHRIDTEKFRMLISCESRWNFRAKGDWRSETNEHMAYGLLQFWPGTYKSYSQKYGIAGGYRNPYSQIELAAAMIADGEWYHWKTCGKLVKLNEDYLLVMR